MCEVQFLYNFKVFIVFTTITWNTIKRWANSYVGIPLTQAIESCHKNLSGGNGSQMGRLLYSLKAADKKISWYCYILVVKIKP